jgi:hypothetical protein
MRERAVAVLAALSMGFLACGKVQDKMFDITPEHITQKFFEAWRGEDWGTLYEVTHPAFMQRLRLQKLTPAQQSLGDRDLFIEEFRRARAANPAMRLRSYKVISISMYKPGDTTIWVRAMVNGKKRKIPLTLDGLSLKVDLTRIEQPRVNGAP